MTIQEYDPLVRQIGLDIDNLRDNKRGRRILNAFLSSNAEMFRTKRGHMALVVRLETFEKLRQQLGIEIEDTYDGLKKVVPVITHATLAS